MDLSLKNIKYFIFDLDGTVYLGNKLLPGAKELLDWIRDNNKEFLFLTNNSSKGIEEYVTKLRRLGISYVRKRNILVSSEVTAEYIAKEKPNARIYLLGNSGLREELVKRGLKIVNNNPEYVVLGLDTSLTYKRLMKACLFIEKGAKFVITHPDKVCPSDIGNLIDCGSIADAIISATGVKPVACGKPNPEMLKFGIKKLKGNISFSAIIGDRLLTDILMGKKLGITTILVLTGSTTRRILNKCKEKEKPDFVFNTLLDLRDYLDSL